MVKQKKRLMTAVIFGGQSTEHEVSIMSAANVIAAANKKKYHIVPVFVTKQGHWHILKGSRQAWQAQIDQVTKKNQEQVLSSEVFSLFNNHQVDVVFCLMHGNDGEDGSVQGMMEILNIPYVGAGVLGSALAMDKEVTKRLLTLAGIPLAKYITIRQGEVVRSKYIFAQLGKTVFVKPANGGSSVGVTRATKDNIDVAIATAFLYDTKILIEQAVAGWEIECSVLGNSTPKVSLPGKIIPQKDFYSYEAKYLDSDGALLEAPTVLPKKMVTKVQDVSRTVYQLLELSGMARVDFFLQPDGTLLVNEINTIPGFTNISMYPKLWEASGLHYTKLIDQLIGLAIQKYKTKIKLKKSY
jgi:D-alanine-D-alanine ligase